jgi:hypothetical protein
MLAARRIWPLRNGSCGLVSPLKVVICARGANPNAVAVRVSQLDLTPPRNIFGCDAKLGSDRVHVCHAEIDKPIRSCITLVLGKKQPNLPARDRHERRKARLEPVLGFLHEAQPGIPRHRQGSVVDAEDGDNGLFDLLILADSLGHRMDSGQR